MSKKYKIKGKSWHDKICLFRVDEDHENIEFFDRMINFVFFEKFLPEGFYTLDPTVGVPEDPQRIIDDYEPLFQIKQNQLGIWLDFNAFISGLSDAHVLSSKKMDLKRVVPYRYLKESDSFRIDGLGLSHSIEHLFALDMQSILELAGTENDVLYDTLEIMAACKLLLYEATEEIITEDPQGTIIRVHWKDERSHRLFVDLTMSAYVYFSCSSSSAKTIYKALQLPDLKEFNIDPNRIKKHQGSLFIMHYMNHFEEYDNFERAANFALSKLVVDKFNL